MSRVDHWADTRYRLPTVLKDPVKELRRELEETKALLAEKDSEIDLLCARIGALKLPPAPFAAHQIIIAVAKKHGITYQELIGPRRTAHLIRARHEAMWEVTQNTDLSLPAAGKIFRRDHTTVLHGIRTHKRRMAA